MRARPFCEERVSANEQKAHGGAASSDKASKTGRPVGYTHPFQRGWLNATEDFYLSPQMMLPYLKKLHKML